MIANKRSRTGTPYFFLLPSVITIGVVIIVPLVFAVTITLNTVDLVRNGGRFVFYGLGNYLHLFKDGRMLHSVIVTLLYVLGAVSSETILSLSIALFLNRRFRGKSLLRTLILIPMFITPVVVALTWRIFYDPTAGIINYVFGALGLGNRIDWLGSATLALPSIIAADIWEWTPFMILIIMAGLDSVPLELYEAAVVDGANELKTIRHVSIPLVLPALGVAVILRTIDAIKTFDLVYVMTQGGPGLATETTNMYAYTTGFVYFKIGYATTIAFVFTMAITVITSFVVNRTFNRRVGA